MTYHPRITKSFVDRADPASFWESWIAGKIARLGYDVTHRHFTIAGEKDDITEHYGSADLSVCAPLATEVTLSYPGPLNLEVKSSNKSALDESTYRTKLVCSAAAWRRKFGKATNIPKGNAFVFVSAVDGSVSCAVWGTPVTFRVITDHSRADTYSVAECDRTVLVPLEKMLEVHFGKR